MANSVQFRTICVPSHEGNSGKDTVQNYSFRHNKEKHEDNKQYGSCEYIYIELLLTELACNGILFLWEGFSGQM
jgi:hypothetical protein